MATSQCAAAKVEAAVTAVTDPPPLTHPGFSNDQYSVLVVVGEYSQSGTADLVLSQIERGELQ